jgi:hypothetical protein
LNQYQDEHEASDAEAGTLHHGPTTRKLPCLLALLVSPTRGVLHESKAYADQSTNDESGNCCEHSY